MAVKVKQPLDVNKLRYAVRTVTLCVTQSVKLLFHFGRPDRGQHYFPYFRWGSNPCKTVPGFLAFVGYPSQRFTGGSNPMMQLVLARYVVR